MTLIDEYLASRNDNLPAGRPWVTLSYAQSIDGCIALRRDSALQLSGPETMHLTHQLRASHQAVLVGIGTVLADDPRLTVRLADGPDPQPVVLDSRLRMLPEARLMQNDCRPWIATLQDHDAHKKAHLESHGARLIPLPAGEDARVSLPALLAELAHQGVRTLMVEGGATVISAFLEQALVDLLVLTIAPVYVGGLHAFEPDILPVAPHPADYPRLQGVKIEQLGEDLVVWGRLKYHP